MSLIICIKSVIFLGLVTDGGLTGTRYFAFLPRTRDQQLPGWADPPASDTRHGAAPSSEYERISFSSTLHFVFFHSRCPQLVINI